VSDKSTKGIIEFTELGNAPSQEKETEPQQQVIYWGDMKNSK
jgi:hypothetical protein